MLEMDDFTTFQEYHLIPSTKAQAMLSIIGNCGEGKSRIGVVLQEIFKSSMLIGSFQRIKTDKLFRYKLKNKLLMHVFYIPVLKGKDRNKNPCLRINCFEFWKGRDSYSKLQDEYFDFITSRGYVLEHGEKGSTAEHLSVSEYKLKKTQEQISELTEQAAKIDDVDNISKKNLPLNMVAMKKSDF